MSSVSACFKVPFRSAGQDKSSGLGPPPPRALRAGWYLQPQQQKVAEAACQALPDAPALAKPAGTGRAGAGPRRHLHQEGCTELPLGSGIPRVWLDGAAPRSALLMGVHRQSTLDVWGRRQGVPWWVRALELLSSSVLRHSALVQQPFVTNPCHAPVTDPVSLLSSLLLFQL